MKVPINTLGARKVLWFKSETHSKFMHITQAALTLYKAMVVEKLRQCFNGGEILPLLHAHKNVI